MPRITWDGEGEKIWSVGTSHGVLYVPSDEDLAKHISGNLGLAGMFSKGVAWNGLTTVTESPSGADEQKFYADNIVYGSLRGAEDFGGTIECYTYPDEFAPCNGEIYIAPGVKGNQQNRRHFGFSYRTELGNDVSGLDYGYELHLIYNATVSPSEVSYETINDSPEPGTMSFEFSCVPVPCTGYKPMSHIVIPSTKVDADKLKSFEDILYGTDDTAARLPLPDEVMSHFKAAETTPVSGETTEG